MRDGDETWPPGRPTPPATSGIPAGRQRRATTTTPVALTLGIGTFVLVAVLSVLAVGAWSGYRNTADLLRQKATLVVDAAVSRLSLHLGAAEEQTRFIARALTEGEVRHSDLDAFVPMLGGALAATPQINALYFLDADHRLTGVERDGDGVVPVFSGLALDPDMRHIVAEAATRHAPYWADLLWRETFDALHVNLRTPVWRDGAFQGVVMALVSVPSLSLLIGDLESQFGYNAYILVDERRVLAHPLLQFGFPGLTRWKPMPTIAELGDPVLNVMWSGRAEQAALSDLVAGPRGHTATLAGDDYVFLYTELEGFGPRPWLVGTYLRARGLTEEIDRLFAALMACGVLIAAALGIAAWMGVTIARPARRLAEAAERAARLDALPSPALPSPPPDLPPDLPPELPGSAFRELDQAVRSFNAMRRRQHGLNAHAPRALVERLAADGRLGQPWAESRNVVVLAGRLCLPEAGAPMERAAALGEVLGALGAAVREAGGMVEQASAQGVMAWWGGLDEEPEAAARAMGAARAIATLSRPAGVALTLGLDAAPAVVAAVPTGDRLTVTVLGAAPERADAIARLALGPLVASGAVVRAAGLNAVSLGEHRLGGPEGATELFRPA